MTRIGLHLLSLLVAFMLCCLCLFVCSFFALAYCSWAIWALAFVAGAGWMVGGLTVAKKHAESGPLLLCSAAALLAWLALGFGDSAMSGLSMFPVVLGGGAFASWFVLRGDQSARRLNLRFALVIVVLATVFSLQVRIPGRRQVLVGETGVEEIVIIAHPLSEAWESTHAAHPISRAGDAIYVWRGGSRALRPGSESEVMRYVSDMDGRKQLLTRLSEPADIDAAYDALWETEEWLIRWEVARGDLPFFMPALTCLRGEWRRGSVWKAEPAEQY